MEDVVSEVGASAQRDPESSTRNRLTELAMKRKPFFFFKKKKLKSNPYKV